MKKIQGLQAPHGATSGSRTKATAAERPMHKDDCTCDGEEVSHWKHAYQAEVCDNRMCQDFSRRVREMRETRLAPVPQKFVAPKFRKKVLQGVESNLPFLQSFPRGMEYVGPMGLG